MKRIEILTPCNGAISVDGQTLEFRLEAGPVPKDLDPRVLQRLIELGHAGPKKSRR